MVLDRSGSMSGVREDTIGGFNTFLEEQQKNDSKCTLSLLQFDTEFDRVHTFKDIQKVPKLTQETFVPRGSTALLDAIGNTIADTEKEIEKLSEKPDKVIFVISTDGEENASREHTKEGINKLIAAHDKWTFVFLGANQDAIQAGTQMGFKANLSMTTANNAKGITAMYNNLSGKIRFSRSASVDSIADLESAMEFSEEDRKEQEDALKK